MPADGWYEWTGPKTGRSQPRTPHLIRPIEARPIAFAGIWAHWLGADGSEMESMAILTVPAGPDIASVAERMPAILPAEHFSAWLDCRGCRAEEAAGFLVPTEAGMLRIEPAERAHLASRTAPRGAQEPNEQPGGTGEKPQPDQTCL